MSILPFYKEISRVTSEVPAGATGGIINVSATPFPLKSGDFIWIRTQAGQSYRIELIGDTDTGGTALRYNTAASGTGLSELLMPIPIDSAVMLPDEQTALLARTSYQYLNATGKASAGTSQNWKFGHLYGVQFYNWNQDTGATGVTVDSSTVAISRQYQHIGFRVPFDCELVGFSGSGKNSNGNRDFAGGLYVGTPQWGTTGDMTMTLRAYSSASYAPGTSFSARAAKFEDLTRSYSITAGDVIYPMIKGLTATNDTLLLNFTIVLKTVKA
jgi:hypothetical protein